MKKGETPGIFFGVLTIVVTLTVMLIFVVPKLTEVLFTSGEEAQCKFDLLLSKTATDVTYGFVKEMQVECKTTRKTITQNDLARYTALASQAIEKYPPDSTVAKEFPLTQEGKDKWALANIIANDMKSCYDRGWRGKLKIGEVLTLKKIFGDLGSDYLCILCTRYTFSPDIIHVAQTPFAIKPWLENNIVGEKTYYDYLTNGQTESLATLSTSESYITTSQPLAVLFIADKDGKGGAYLRSYSELTSSIPARLVAANYPVSTLNPNFKEQVKPLIKQTFDSIRVNPTESIAVIYIPRYYNPEKGDIYVAENSDSIIGYKDYISSHPSSQLIKNLPDEFLRVKSMGWLTGDIGLSEYNVFDSKKPNIVIIVFKKDGSSYGFFSKMGICKTIIGD